MSSSGQEAVPSASELRARLAHTQDGPLQAETNGQANDEVKALNEAKNMKVQKDGKPTDPKTYGRTPDGAVFTVPETHDMVSQLFSPSEPKNMSDFILIGFLAFHVSMLYWVPSSVRIPFTGLVYLSWRAAYNAGIGWLLWQQSNHKLLTTWARQSGIFDHAAKERGKRHWLRSVLKRELEAKIPKDYKFETAPLEYNTWLVFRRIVDVILLCDFVSYCVFAIACGGRPDGEGFLLTAARWAGGIALFLFNLWVKLDAHRVVKDYAWYWGDFFFLIDQDLTFDGVFEMAPHPMYSVGYAGYYGISLMAASYKVLFISILGHAAQMAFLTYVENPHIEKTYSALPPPRRRPLDGPPGSQTVAPDPVTIDSDVLDNTRKGLLSFDPHRLENVATVLVLLYLAALTLLTPYTPVYQAFFVVNAAIWRLWFSLGIGFILDSQSCEKSWTRHFIKYGETTGRAWRQWKGLYLLSLTMTHASFVAAAFKMYALPANWSYGWAILRHVLGLALVALQVWTAASIWQSLGDFGWYFGDFFFDTPGHQLTYSGIYRFLNNPERVIGLAGLWGVALITWKTPMFFLALISHLLSLAFIQFVEKPHMQRRYGADLRRQSGLSKSIRRALPTQLRRWPSYVDSVVDDSVEFIEDIVDSAKPYLAKGVGSFVNDTRKLLRQYPGRISISNLSLDLSGVNPLDYGLQIEGSPSEAHSQISQRAGREGVDARGERNTHNGMGTLMFEYGTPVKVRWTVPKDHSQKDWIGLYIVSDNESREVTRVTSHGRWVPTNKADWTSASALAGLISSDAPVNTDTNVDKSIRESVTGEAIFSGDRLYWTTGVFEFRYHHAGKHTVITISRPFEIRIPHFDDLDSQADSNVDNQHAIEEALLPVVQNCLDRDPDVAPRNVEEDFSEFVWREGKWAKRVVYAVHQMFGIEFSPEVVKADGTVRKLAWRICNAKKVLAPYSMSSSRGRSTPRPNTPK